MYEPIQNYGLIGNMRTAALVGMNGSIDWYCIPYFDSPSVFGALLDDEEGGRFQITPLWEEHASRQFYWPDTNILITRFQAPDGTVEIEDFMPAGLPLGSPWLRQLVRRVRAPRGAVELQVVCHPVFDYARTKPEVEITPHGAVFSSSELRLSLATRTPLEADAKGVTARFTLEAGETAVFVLRQIEQGQTPEPSPLDEETEELFQTTVHYWRRWLSACTYTGRWREVVRRSALALKLLTFEPTGAIVAAPTTSLPEALGGVRNWDYRYTWIRDAAFTLYGLLRIGFTEEAASFMRWLDERCHEAFDEGGQLQIVYGVNGRRDLREYTLDHLEGYRNSRPVRIGNGAYNQLQIDIYGELMDAVYLFNKYGSPISYDMWLHLRRLLDWVCDNWQRPDEGIWEVRSGRQHFIYSKLMCWVALDRGLRLADKRSFPADIVRWRHVRNRIYEEIMNKGWSKKRKAFVQYYGGQALDASSLIMPLVFFVGPTDPRMLGTLDAVNRRPDEGGLVVDGLVYRYDLNETEDGLKGEEGTFNMCTFWLVEALTRAGRIEHHYLEEARLLFERMLGYSSHLGLYAEETGDHGEALGNFPQAFTHLSLISAAFNLDRTLNEVRMY